MAAGVAPKRPLVVLIGYQLYEILDRSDGVFAFYDISQLDCEGGWCAWYPNSFGPRGSGEHAVPDALESLLGRQLSGAFIFDGGNPPHGFANNGEVAWHEMTHLVGLVNGDGRLYIHSPQDDWRFCDLPTAHAGTPPGASYRMRC